MKYSLLDKLQVALFVLFTPNFWAVLIFSAVVLYAFCGCATRVYENGHLVMESYGDSSNFEFTKQGSSIALRATRLNHSKATQAAFDGAGKVITAGGAAAALFAP